METIMKRFNHQVILSAMLALIASLIFGAGTAEASGTPVFKAVSLSGSGPHSVGDVVDIDFRFVGQLGGKHTQTFSSVSSHVTFGSDALDILTVQSGPRTGQIDCTASIASMEKFSKFEIPQHTGLGYLPGEFNAVLISDSQGFTYGSSLFSCRFRVKKAGITSASIETIDTRRAKIDTFTGAITETSELSGLLTLALTGN